MSMPREFDDCTCLAIFGSTGRTEMCFACFEIMVKAAGVRPPTLEQLDGKGVIVLTSAYEDMVARIDTGGR